jgi:hypothetical protein
VAEKSRKPDKPPPDQEKRDETPFQRFERLAKRLAQVPKDKVQAPPSDKS